MNGSTKELILSTPELPSRDEVAYRLVADQDISDPWAERVYDDETLREIQARLDRGDIWAWASVDVEATWTNPLTDKTYEGHAYLGGCSYDDARDFKQNSGYYEDMKGEAYEDLIKQIERDAP